MKKYLGNIVNLINIIINKKIFKKPDFSEKKIVLQGLVNEKKNLEKKSISNLGDVEFSVFSQFGEDGIISWLTNQIPNISSVFLEVGTQDYWESNTRFLVHSRNWKGYLIEASLSDVNKIKKQSLYWKKDLKVINEFINCDNINNIITKNLGSKNLGLFSLDIDGNDYWILKEAKIEADIVVCEYNPIFGDLHELTIPYNKDFSRKKKHYSNLFFGCSICALIQLMKKKDYEFIGTNTQGMNAFFISKKNLKYFENKIREKKIHFPLTKEGRDENGKLNYKKFYENIKLIENEKILDLKNEQVKKISDLKNLYSNEWKSKF